MTVAVFFDPTVVPTDLPFGAPLWKFSEVDADWRARFPDLERPAFTPATIAQVARVHDQAHVDGVMSGTTRNGLGTRIPEHAAAALADVGAFMAAARHVIATGYPAVSIGGGFHHAGYARSHAFCTFNGLMAAAMDLQDAGLVDKAAILDLDNHFGDGTQDIRTRMGLDDPIFHYVYAHEFLDAGQVGNWLDQLDRVIERMHGEGADIVLYNAGVDSHVGDPMTKGVLSTEQMRRREEIVFGTCARLGLPIAWTLAGGYQRAPGVVTRLHEFAMEAALASSAKLVA